MESAAQVPGTRSPKASVVGKGGPSESTRSPFNRVYPEYASPIEAKEGLLDQGPVNPKPESCAYMMLG